MDAKSTWSTYAAKSPSAKSRAPEGEPVTTRQPNWKLVGNLGDNNVVAYGGFLVYEDTTGVYPPEAELYEPNEQEETGGSVYRFILERPRFKTLKTEGKSRGLYTAQLPAAERGKTWYWYTEWFVSDLDSVASSAGTTKFQLLRLLFSNNTLERASAYQTLRGHFAPDNFDSYPLTITEEEAKKRYQT